ncbi:MAG: cell division protein FtsA [Alphaproteobacteria bacterium 64-6]|nr:MAG: cell division protein FtsA [Alphaproteobacteria bacterium 64-6]
MNNMDRSSSRPPPLPRGAPVIAALDIGTSKVVCLIATGEQGGRTRLLGIGHQRSGGMKAGMVIDPDAAELAVRAAVGQAERMAGVTMEQVSIAVACGRLKSQRFVARVRVDTGIAHDGDVARALAGGEAYAARGGRTLIQFHNEAWHLDGAEGVADPRGMAGSELSADLVAVTADDGPLQNLLAVVERCYLEPHQLAATPYASAMAVTTEEERQLGVLVVDIGAGVTSIAAFFGGRLAMAEVLPVGAQLVTFDIARRLGTSVTEAERIKTLYGTLLPARSNDHESFSFSVSDGVDETTARVSRAELRSLIVPRIHGIAALVNERVVAAKLERSICERVVLTGGGAGIEGIDSVWGGLGDTSGNVGAAARGASVRIGRPSPIDGMSTDMLGPAFATVSGLIGDSLQQHFAARTGGLRGWRGGGYVSWIGNWLSRAKG